MKHNLVDNNKAKTENDNSPASATDKTSSQHNQYTPEQDSNFYRDSRLSIGFMY
jgi:hypothetical protein